MDFDLLIRNGELVDGLGGPPVPGDVGIKGDRLERIGRLGEVTACDVLDARGLWVAPGFIDVHNHAHSEAAGGILKIPEADNMLRQGVTTLIAGNCGGSPWPIGEHLEEVSRLGIRQNYGLLLGHGTIRARAKSTPPGPASDDEIARMKELARQGLEEGAFGISTGYFGPGVTTEELIEVSRTVAANGGLYASHIRSEAQGLLEAVEEIIRICDQAELPVQISHLKTLGRHAWGRLDAMLALIHEARDRGLDVSADRYPYVWSFTGVAALIPTDLREEIARRGGMAHLRDPDIADQIVAGINGELDMIEGPENVVFAPLKPDPELDGLTLAQVARARGLEPHELIIELCTRGRVSCIYHSMKEENLKTILRQPFTMIGSDGHLRQFGQGVSHPRNYGTFPRALGRYGRRERCFSLQEGVKRMTSMPAAKFGIKDRGVIAEGNFADLVIFDPCTIEDRATFENGHQYPIGIPHIIVNGKVAVRDGATTEAKAGRVLRRH